MRLATSGPWRSRPRRRHPRLRSPRRSRARPPFRRCPRDRRPSRPRPVSRSGSGRAGRCGSAGWVGAVALALGGLFLVRYSIEQGWLGPGARVAAGALLALALIGAGERLRRRDLRSPLPGIPSAHVPGVLTAAGSSTAFATAYAAYGLYGFIGPGTAFAALGAVAILTLVAASLHGPALAALGLVAALGSPLLVETREPNPGALALYLLFATFAAYGVARLRLWRWLAVAGAAGAIVWALLLAIEAAIGSVMAHVLLQTGLAGLFLVADPYRRVATVGWPTARRIPIRLPAGCSWPSRRSRSSSPWRRKPAPRAPSSPGRWRS